MSPQITVGIPVYNGEPFLAEAIHSVQTQTVEDIEIIVSDNASTDGTEEICRSIAAEDPRVRYVRNETNLGGPGNTNLLVHEASAPLFKWAYSDDICGPTLLQDCVEALDATPGSVLACPRVVKIDKNGDVLFAHEDAVLGFDAPEAHVRLRRIFRTMGEQALFGVIRTDALRRTRLVQRHLSDGFILMTELCMQGSFPQVASPQLFVRMHDDHYGANRRSQFRWIQASRRRDRVFAYTRTTRHLIDAINRSDQPADEKRRCRNVVLRDWTLRNWRSIASDVKNFPDDLRTR